MILTLCTKLTAGHSLDETIALAARYGFHGLEIFGLPEHLPPEAEFDDVVRWAELVKDAGLRVWCLATYVGPYGEASPDDVERMLGQVRRYCQFADLLGCKYIRQVSAMGSPSDLSEEVWRRTAEGLRAAADVAAEYDKWIVLETHDGQIVETPESTVKLVGMIGRENIGVTFDPGNHVRRPADYGPRGIGKLGSLIVNVHIKDATVDRQQRLFGEGDMDWALVWEGLAEIGYDGAIGVECHVKPSDELTVTDIIAHEVAAIRQSLLQAGLGGKLEP